MKSSKILVISNPFSHAGMRNVPRINNRKLDPFLHGGMREWVVFTDLQFTGHLAKGAFNRAIKFKFKLHNKVYI